MASFQSIEDHDEIVASGMEEAARDSGERLEGLLTTIQAR